MLRQQSYELEFTKEKIKSLNEKQAALDTLHEEGFKIREEIMKWRNEDRQTRDQEKLKELETLREEISQQRDDLYKIIKEEREELFPPQPEDLSKEAQDLTQDHTAYELQLIGDGAQETEEGTASF